MENQKETKILASIIKVVVLLLFLSSFSSNYLVSDGTFVDKEIERVYKNNKQIADSLNHTFDANTYINFAIERYVALAYEAKTLAQLNQYHDSLFYINALYAEIIEYDSIVYNKIAKNIVYSLETGFITNEDSIINTVVAAIKKNILMVYGAEASVEDQRKIVVRYARQYYNRGIISMAEPIFRQFRQLYKTNQTTPKPIKFCEDYQIFDKQILSGLTINKIPSPKIIIFNQNTDDYNLIYLISILRTISDNYSNKVVIARDVDILNDVYINAIGRNLASNLYYINLTNEDTKYYDDAPSFVVLGTDNKITYRSNNPVDFLEWLEVPFPAQKVAKNNANYK